MFLNMYLSFKVVNVSDERFVSHSSDDDEY